ncbi:MAG: hypothetical protein SFV54_15225 [Bryobacteraceae bacterium]|nr:hypothetical protein [Bryobacteraceae bacterium]
MSDSSDSEAAELHVGIALANLHDQSVAKEVDRELIETGGGRIQSVFGESGGGIRAAAFDYWGYIGNAADLITVGTALYGAYKLIEQGLDSLASKRADIYVFVPEQHLQIEISRMSKERDEFLKELETRLQPLLRHRAPRPAKKARRQRGAPRKPRG